MQRTPKQRAKELALDLFSIVPTRSSGALGIQWIPRTLRQSKAVNKGTQYLLLLGPSRSGTSLVQRLLNAHPAICMTYESIYYPLLNNLSGAAIQSYYYEVIKQSDHLARALQPESHLAKAQTFQQAYAYFGDKVIYQDDWRFRLRLRRAARRHDFDKLVALVRDPRARSLSLLDWSDERGKRYRETAGAHRRDKPARSQRILAEAEKWNRFIADLSTLSNTCTVHTLRYEDLVQAPAATFKAILAFLELNPGDYSRTALEGIHTKSVDLWQRQLPKELIAAVTEKTREGLKKLGYDL